MKLAKQPDRKPVKMNVVLAPSLARRLHEYADFYPETYGSREEVVELIPFMLDAFLDSDAAFEKGKKGAEGESGTKRSTGPTASSPQGVWD